MTCRRSDCAHRGRDLFEKVVVLGELIIKTDPNPPRAWLERPEQPVPHIGL